MKICMTVFYCGLLTIFENEVNKIHKNKTTISLTSHNALIKKQAIKKTIRKFS